MQGELDPVRQVEIQVFCLLNFFSLVEFKKLLDQDVKKCWVVTYIEESRYLTLAESVLCVGTP